VDCKECELAIALQVVLVTVYKSSINLVTNPNSMSSH
jgi:hypothetical protein